jgi:hypothetical protein
MLREGKKMDRAIAIITFVMSLRLALRAKILSMGTPLVKNEITVLLSLKSTSENLVFKNIVLTR